MLLFVLSLSSPSYIFLNTLSNYVEKHKLCSGKDGDDDHVLTLKPQLSRWWQCRGQSHTHIGPWYSRDVFSSRTVIALKLVSMRYIYFLQTIYWFEIPCISASSWCSSRWKWITIQDWRNRNSGGKGFSHLREITNSFHFRVKCIKASVGALGADISNIPQSTGSP